MKITMTPADGEPTESLEELGSMIRRAQAALVESATDSDGSAPARFRVRITIGGKVKALEVTR